MIALNAAARERAETKVTRVYPVGGVLDGTDRKYPYAVVSVSFDDATTYTLDARHSVQMYRLTTQAFSDEMDGALATDAKLRAAFLDQWLTAPGWECGPALLQVGGAIVREPEAGEVIGVTSTYLFTAKEIA